MRLYFQDEARIGQKGRVCHIWWKRGERPPGLLDQRYISAYIYAAVEPGTDNTFSLILPDAYRVGMQAFLNAFAETIADDEHVVLVLDGAGWHGSKTLRVPSNISLVRLPPYSPELNPVERVWLYLKQRSCRCACSTTIRRSSQPHRKPGSGCADRPDASRRSRHTLGS
ncbi:MAG: IS630 family transposase [Hyphomicrobiaceae bacterium]|nr:IS630 family transposase [Hyphomicrobiaceae bacterium]